MQVPPGKPPARAWKWLAIIAIFLLALFLRWHGMAEYPPKEHSNYEYHYVWAGLTLLNIHDTVYNPTHLNPQRREELTWMPGIIWNNRSYTNSSPFIHEPPLFQSLVGGWAALSDMRVGTKPQGKTINHYLVNFDTGPLRYLSLAFFCATFFLLFAIAREAFSFPIALISILLYSISIHIAVHNRLLIPENLTTPLALLAIWILQRFSAGRMREKLAGPFLMLCSAAVVLCQMAALPLIIGVIAAAFFCKNSRAGLYLVTGSLGGTLATITFGCWRGGSHFWPFFLDQFGEFQSIYFLGNLFVTPMLLNQEDFDYMLLTAWIALFIALFQRRKSPVFIVPLTFLLASNFIGPLPRYTGWRALPLYPFLCMAMAWLVCEVYGGSDPMLDQKRLPDRPSSPRANPIGSPVVYLGFLALFLPHAFDLVSAVNESHSTLLRRAYLIAVPMLLYASFSSKPIARKITRLSIILIFTEMLLSQLWRSLLEGAGA